ncbi:major facilitator superfamily domain-containing protein [Boletus reticuloceps]|uniref:Major facilitator superfamily domain-containing protein n=1 Tax=Boletus reticuloceps TaxID=495285 RepID=A0A8I2YW45_9AGAM|nr:major facilitator superfamily domain-containing protein [Boletus reticuloceps]
MTAAAASSFSISTPSLTYDLHCTELEATLGLGLYAVGFGIVPLVTSSFSEEIGRRPVYIFSSVVFTLTQIMVALAPNIGTVLAGRALGGIFGSTGASLVGGSVADIWQPQERGLPMTLFAFTSLFSIGLGSVIGGVIQSSLGWRWVQWIHIMFSFFFIILVALVMSETRASIILIQIARSQRKLTGNNAHRAKAEIDRESLWSLIKTSCSRPLYFLLTEPIVQSFSIWCGFVWGVVYCFLESITPIFQTTYGFNVQQTGYVYITLCIGATIGFFANLYQDKLYRRHFARKEQEARLYLVCVAALCLPIGMFIFAWTASPKIHWIAPIVGLSVFMSGVMVIFQVTFLYLADCYNTYASSAQAGQSLFRNSMALVFPLFTQQMFVTLTYKWALTLFAILALVMAPTPFVLFFYGSRIRARSIASRNILATDVQAQHSHTSSSSSASRPGMDKV